MSKRMITHYEGNTDGPPMKKVIALSKALNVTTSYLVGESPLKLVKDDTGANLKKQLDTLQRMNPRDRKAILRMIEIASQNISKE